jgi:TRAP-type C4-dicarboxylate transport system substrate-binding protein
MWDGFWFLANRRAWQKLPTDIQEIVEAELNASGIQERADIAKLNDTLAGSLKQHGMVFEQTDAAAFRAKLKQAGFYAEWQKKFGKKAWDTLEGAVGSLA